MTLASRELTIQFQLNDGTSFDGSGNNTYTASGLRAAATIERVGTGGLDTAIIRVFGLPPSVMAQLSTLGKRLYSSRNNIVTVQAGVEGGTLATVYIGVIQSAYLDGAGMPDVPLMLQTSTTALVASRTIPPSSFRGPVDVATVIAGLATQAQAAFQNFGVTAQAPATYLSGSAWTQAKRLADTTHTELIIDKETWVIWPKGTARGGQIPLISPTTGLVGYPAFTSGGLLLTTLFNPEIAFGGQIEVQSSLRNATGTWDVFNMSHQLESQTYGGAWFTTIECLSKKD